MKITIKIRTFVRPFVKSLMPSEIVYICVNSIMVYLTMKSVEFVGYAKTFHLPIYKQCATLVPSHVRILRQNEELNKIQFSFSKTCQRHFLFLFHLVSGISANKEIAFRLISRQFCVFLSVCVSLEYSNKKKQLNFRI